MESIEAPTRVKEVEERPEDFLAHFTRPENKVLAFRDEVFPSTYQLGHGLEAIMHRYPTLGTIDPVGAINLHQRPEVMTWVETNQSELLWIEGFTDVEKSDWTTNFSLEVEGAARAYSNITVLIFFCSEETGSTSFSGPEVVLQSLLFQLIDRHYSKFSWLLCRRYGLTRYRFQEAQNELDLLMTLFEDCLDVAEATCLYIVLDNIDALWSKVCIGSEGIEKFDWLFDGLRKLSVGNKILCKVLITSRLPNALNHISRSGDSSANSTGHTYWSQIRHTIIRLPRGERQGIQVFGRPKNMHRIPIRRRTAPRDVPEADLLLEMADKDEEELDYLDDDDDDVLVGSYDWRDSDDDEYGNDLLQHNKDYAKYLDSSSDSSSEIEGEAGRKSNLKRGSSSADKDSDVGANIEELLPGRDDELRHMMDGDEGGSAHREGSTQSVEQQKEEVEEGDRDSDECDLSLGI